MAAHIREGVRRASRRINRDRGSSGRNLCGADFTDRDITVSQGRRMTVNQAAEWDICADCVRVLSRREAVR